MVTFQGLDIDASFAVRDEAGEPIRGLFAVGEVIGAGATCGNSFCSGMLLTPALTFGRLVGAALGGAAPAGAGQNAVEPGLTTPSERQPAAPASRSRRPTARSGGSSPRIAFSTSGRGAGGDQLPNAGPNGSSCRRIITPQKMHSAYAATLAPSHLGLVSTPNGSVATIV